MTAPPLPMDTRSGQAQRVADFMKLHPEGVTHSQITAACDVGSSTKLVSLMPSMGYRIAKKTTAIACAGGSCRRRVRLIVLLGVPSHLQPELF